MTNFNVIARNLMAGTAMMALAACGADDIASPGTGGNVTINNNTTTAATAAAAVNGFASFGLPDDC